MELVMVVVVVVVCGDSFGDDEYFYDGFIDESGLGVGDDVSVDLMISSSGEVVEVFSRRRNKS